ncbi:uncharacterized protein FOMMEDRAFT_17759 [Fomitiporia mediterranea MF3/22]|uniref:uncharacterized protein n=1 Tax=Fomitiporia mediterranea (strain MF3/22) TaxID=694068 RepID=UPI00044098F8|nr:uncharacterized protein FOMMEDRAFT_17759 [Fomitiporia mediterranea MF3/22]EJD05465.1 hypothetical protein FOMMEDRAFT_17759 [Fomitiporia mediterranea MF3/22]
MPASSSPGPISPVSEVQARRRGQYKSRLPTTSSIPSMRSGARFRKGPTRPIPFNLGPVTADAGQAAFLRERFKADCLERARRAREKGLARRRASASSDASSDGLDVDMNVDSGEDDEADDNYNSGFDDELFHRVIANEKRKKAHAYALSYELDVGSSFDPDMEDPTLWEEHLAHGSSSQSSNHRSQVYPEDETSLSPDELGDIPDFDEYDLDDMSAWADEYIASLPLESIPVHHTANSNIHYDEATHQQMDITMG